MLHKKETKRTYCLRNWKEYNKALVGRGSLTLWVSDEVIAQWRARTRTAKRGRPRTYTDTVILCLATLAEVYRLPLRATEGLLRSVVGLLGVDLDVPTYTTPSPTAKSEAGIELTPYNPKLSRQMEMAEQVMREDRDALQKLAE